MRLFQQGFPYRHGQWVRTADHHGDGAAPVPASCRAAILRRAATASLRRCWRAVMRRCCRVARRVARSGQECHRTRRGWGVPEGSSQTRLKGCCYCPQPGFRGRRWAWKLRPLVVLEGAGVLPRQHHNGGRFAPEPALGTQRGPGVGCPGSQKPPLRALSGPVWVLPAAQWGDLVEASDCWAA